MDERQLPLDPRGEFRNESSARASWFWSASKSPSPIRP